MEYTVPNLEYAVKVFYNSEQNERAQAHQWLAEAQRCPEAWAFVWELLQSNKGTEIQFFAATTLHTKILRCWGEVPPDKYEELKDKILQAVLAYSSGPKIVLNRLCISLAAFVLQQGSVGLTNILRPLSTAENRSLLLEVLTVIPEEFNSMTMGTSLRTQNRILLQQACPAVLDDMMQYLQSSFSVSNPSSEMVSSWLSAAVCAGSWLSLGADEEEAGIRACLSDRLPLCHALFNVVHVLYTSCEAVSDGALETCEAALGAVRTAGSRGDAGNQPSAALALAASLAHLATPIFARDSQPNSINEELLSAIATCAVSLGECHSKCIVSAVEQDPPNEGATQFIQLLLDCQAAPGHFPVHETRSQLVFGFWYTLQDQILDNESSHPTWKEVFTRLLTVLIKKSECAERLCKDDAELLRRYRQDIADTVMYCYSILGENCWSIVESAWLSATTSSRREAALHTLVAMSEVARENSPVSLHNMLVNAVNAITNDQSNTQLVDTALECLGAFAGYIATCRSPLELGGAALRACGSALSAAPRPAALALRRLTAECTTVAAPLASDIVQAVKSEWCSGEPWVRRQLLMSAGAALSAAPLETAGPLLHQLADIIQQDLVKQGKEPSKSHGSAEAAAALLSALVSRPDLAAGLVRTILPTLTPYALHPQLVHHLFVVLKASITVLMDDCLPMIDEIGRLILQASETQPCPSGIETVRFLVLMFYNVWPGAGTVCAGTVTATLRMSQLGGNSDVTEALFTNLTQITKKKPNCLVAIDHLLDQLISLASECVSVWEPGVSRSACVWVGCVCAYRPRDVLPHSHTLTHHVLRAIGGATPRSQVEPLADVLWSFSRTAWPPNSGTLADWLRHALQQDDFPTAHATPQHKQKFIAAVLKEKSSKRRLLDTVQEFSLVCRGLIGTEYARQTLAAKQLVS